MALKCGVVMDPIGSIKPYKDTTFALLLAAQQEGHELFYMEEPDLWVQDGIAWGAMRKLSLQDQLEDWYTFGETVPQPLHTLDIILMRKDPPFDMDYIYTTYLLELAEKQGTRVINRPQALRDANEKMFATWFPHCMAPTLVTCQLARMRQFLIEQREVIVKPLNGMGGESIYKLTQYDQTTIELLQTMTHQETRYIMLQRYIPEIVNGDKRILLINGEPIPYALARIPKPGAVRANLAAGGEGVGATLTERDHWICRQIGPTLREKGLIFVGIDVIGDYLTEINVTSPTCLREISQAFNIDIAMEVWRCINQKIDK